MTLYWELGRDIVTQQETTAWGEGLIPRFAKDLNRAFPHLKGFSRTNLFYVRKWYLFFKTHLPIVPQLVGQFQQDENNAENEFMMVFFSVPWGHHRHILDKCSDLPEVIFYLKKTVQNNWSRDVLVSQMKQNLYARQGKAITNFEWTLPKPQSDLAIELFKNPYNFDFLNIGDDAQEREVENAPLWNMPCVILTSRLA